MHRLSSSALVALVALAGPLSAQDRRDVDPTVTFAKSWDAAVEEARLLNAPIVVHSHGFY